MEELENNSNSEYESSEGNDSDEDSPIEQFEGLELFGSENKGDSETEDIFLEDIEIEKENLFAEINSLRIETFENLNKKLIRNQVLWPDFQDITPSFDDEVPFLVDGDSLLLTVCTDTNYSPQLGGNSLHLVYLFERYLDVFVKRGGTFHIVFFQYWRDIWHRVPNMSMYRQIIMSHFTKNSKYPVHLFQDCFAERFLELVAQIRPGFILTNFNAYDEYTSLVSNTDVHYLKYIINIQLLYWLSIDIPCIDTGCIVVDAYSVKGFYIDKNIHVKLIVTIYLKRFKMFINNLAQVEDIGEIKCCDSIKEKDIKTISVLSAAELFYQTGKNINMLKTIFLTIAVSDCLPLKNRCCPKFANTTPKLDKLIQYWHQCLYFALIKLDHIDCDWCTVADIWQGTLFGHCLRFVSDNGVKSAEDLGVNVANIYENFVENFNQFGHKISPYPVEVQHDFDIDWQFTAPKTSKDELSLLKINNTLVSEFCSDILQGIQWTEVTDELHYKKLYSEIHHYHSMRVIRDEYNHIKDTEEKVPEDPWLKKRYLKKIQKHARYMSIYGSSIEGRPLERSAVIRNTKANNKKENKAAKLSKNAQKIIDENRKKREIESDKQPKLNLDKLEARLKTFKNSDITADLKEINTILNKLRPNSPHELHALYLKLKILLRGFKSKDTGDALKKEIFLTIRKVLTSFDCKDMTKSQQELFVKGLNAIECTEIAIRNGITTRDKNSVTDDKWIRYQIEDLGPELVRETLGQIDSRVSGFIPDPWQRQLFDIIDKKESAIIVAPTSSGKTYASYYCMESVLRESSDGIVVYVAPTKALVNQVAATVYARFKDTSMRPGMSVFGVFTRDFTTNSLNSQILVTVPQCLEILLMSPRRHSWVQKLRYVIFDEVHCIAAANSSSLAWERCLLLIRCPFLALSATIRYPTLLQSWLQNAENYKLKRDTIDNCTRQSYKVHLVEHTERHSDLTKFTYSADGIKHKHPYSDLEHSVMELHDGLPNSMILSPAETMQLYDAMYEANRYSNELNRLSPMNYFSQPVQNGYITRDLVRKYEINLASLLTEWYRNEKTHFYSTVNQLKSSCDQAIVETDRKYILKEITNLVTTLNTQNMLPAIVFIYDRSLLMQMTNRVTQFYMNKTKSEDRRKEKRTDKLEKMEKKKSQREAVEKGFDTATKRSQRRLNFFSGDPKNSLRGPGIQDSKDIQFIERRLMQVIPANSIYVNAIRNGIGMHHAGLNSKIRSAVEMLYRSRMINLVFATSTLALGIHMPCKTTVIVGNSVYLNSLEYHQMSGRAGRRGYDTAGNVVFFGINPRKQHSLLTAKLPDIKGNFPMTVTQILRLLLLVTDVTDKGKPSEIATNISVSRVMTLLENFLIYTHDTELKEKLKYFFAFSLQLLKIQEFINEEGEPLLWTGMATHLHYHEPGNLAFVYLLNNGIIRKICTEIDNDADIQTTLLIVLSHLFTYLPVPPKSSTYTYKNSKVILDRMPNYVYQALKLYNKQISFVFDQYFSNIARNVTQEDNVLPLTSIKILPKSMIEDQDSDIDNLQKNFLNLFQPKLVCSSFAALSGNQDDNLLEPNSLISNVKQELYDENQVIPLINLNQKRNAYVLDFYRHGIIASIREDNGLKQGLEYNLLKDFMLVLRTIIVSLEEMMIDETDIVYHHFRLLSDKYSYIFGKTAM